MSKLSDELNAIRNNRTLYKTEKPSLPVDNIVSYDSFEDWWYRFGSGIGVIDGDDFETHAKKVASVAYQVGILHGINYEQNAKNS